MKYLTKERNQISQKLPGSEATRQIGKKKNHRIEDAIKIFIYLRKEYV
jgi:hypothetical protein